MVFFSLKVGKSEDLEFGTLMTMPLWQVWVGKSACQHMSARSPLGLKLKLPKTWLGFLDATCTCHFELCSADGLWVGLPYSRRRKVVFTYLYINYFPKIHRILRMRSEFRQTRNKPHGGEKSSSIFHVGPEVIQSLANKCLYTFLLKYLWCDAIISKHYSQLYLTVIQPLVQITSDKRTFIMILFLVLGFHEISVPEKYHVLCFCFTWVHFSFKQPDNSWLGQRGKMMGHC